MLVFAIVENNTGQASQIVGTLDDRSKIVAWGEGDTH